MADSPNRTQLWLSVIGTVVTVLTVLLSISVYIEDKRTQLMNQRIEALEEKTQGQIDNIRARIDRVEMRNWEVFRLIDEDIRRISEPPQFSEPPP